MARVGVEAGGLAGGWLVGAGGAGGVDRGPLCVNVVPVLRLLAGGLPGGVLVGAR